MNGPNLWPPVRRSWIREARGHGAVHAHSESREGRAKAQPPRKQGTRLGSGTRSAVLGQT